MADFFHLKTLIVCYQTWIARIYGGERCDTTEKGASAKEMTPQDSDTAGTREATWATKGD